MAIANDRLPTSRTALTTGSRCSSFREHRATSAPARANSIAIDLPMPVPPPVTIAVLPSSEKGDLAMARTIPQGSPPVHWGDRAYRHREQNGSPMYLCMCNELTGARRPRPHPPIRGGRARSSRGSLSGPAATDRKRRRRGRPDPGHLPPGLRTNGSTAEPRRRAGLGVHNFAIDLLTSYRTPGALGQPRRHRLAAARGRRGAARHLRGAAPPPGNTPGQSAPGSGPATLAVSRAPGARRWLLVQGNLRDPRDSAGNGDVAPLSGAATSANRASRTDPRHTEHLMTCAEVPSVLDAYLDGELSVAATLQAHEHFSACENCRRILESEAALHGLLVQAARADPVPTDHLRGHILCNLDTGPPAQLHPP